MANDKIIQDKIAFRDKMRYELQNLSQNQLDILNQKIQNQFLAHDYFADADNIAFFMPLKTEPNIIPLIKNCMGRGKNCFIPKVINARDIVFFCLNNDEMLENQVERGTYGIFEPQNRLKQMQNEINNAKKSVILVPCLAFDKNFCRLGKGGGFYDRFFDKARAAGMKFYKIGVCFDFQVLQKIPVAKFDVGVDKIITEKQVYDFPHLCS